MRDAAKLNAAQRAEVPSLERQLRPYRLVRKPKTAAPSADSSISAIFDRGTTEIVAGSNDQSQRRLESVHAEKAQLATRWQPLRRQKEHEEQPVL
jgi:hypothetical protein